MATSAESLRFQPSAKQPEKKLKYILSVFQTQYKSVCSTAGKFRILIGDVQQRIVLIAFIDSTFSCLPGFDPELQQMSQTLGET